MNVLRSTGAMLDERFSGAGYVVGLLVAVLRLLPRLPRRARFCVDVAFNAGVRTLPVTMIVAAFV